jgi:hypothetical protein
MYSQEEIFEFIKIESGIDHLSLNDDLLNDQGIYTECGHYWEQLR